jgi:hypothetical protein
MTLTLDDFGHGTLTMDGVAASGRRPLLTILVRYFNGTVDLPNPIQFYKDLLWTHYLRPQCRALLQRDVMRQVYLDRCRDSGAG